MRLLIGFRFHVDLDWDFDWGLLAGRIGLDLI